MKMKLGEFQYIYGLCLSSLANEKCFEFRLALFTKFIFLRNAFYNKNKYLLKSQTGDIKIIILIRFFNRRKLNLLSCKIIN